MLKLNYSELGLHLERTTISLELLIAQRVVLALRLGRSLYVEPGYASFLLPADIPELEVLEAALQREYHSAVVITLVDDEFVEVSLSGSWIAEDKAADAGMFLTVMSSRTEFLIYKLWQMSETHVTTLA